MSGGTFSLLSTEYASRGRYEDGAGAGPGDGPGDGEGERDGAEPDGCALRRTGRLELGRDEMRSVRRCAADDSERGCNGRRREDRRIVD